MRELNIDGTTTTIHDNGLVYYADEAQMICWESISDALAEFAEFADINGSEWWTETNRKIAEWLREQEAK